MLSGETAVGKFPVGAVHVMAHIAEVTEQYLATLPASEPLLKLKTMHLSAAVAKGVWQIAKDLKVKLVAVWSQTGSTARIFSKARFPVSVVALSSNHRVLRRMTLHYGVVPQEMIAPADLRELVDGIDALVAERKYATAGDRVVIVAGAALGAPSLLNGIIVHTVGEPPTPTTAATWAAQMEGL
jgi:pyruvate kinase